MSFLRAAAIAVILIAAAGPAGAETPVPDATTLIAPQPMPSPTHHHHHHDASASPGPHASKKPFMTFTNPSSSKHGQPTASGASCTRNAASLPQRTNPITGQPQAATIVSVPLTKGGGSVASATNRQQQLDACAHR